MSVWSGSSRSPISNSHGAFSTSLVFEVLFRSAPTVDSLSNNKAKFGICHSSSVDPSQSTRSTSIIRETSEREVDMANYTFCLVPLGARRQPSGPLRSRLSATCKLRLNFTFIQSRQRRMRYVKCDG